MNAIQNQHARFSTIGILLSFGVIICGAGACHAHDEKPMHRLLERIDRYMSLFAQEQYDRAYEMLAERWRKDDDDKREWVTYAARMGRGVKLKHWSVTAISTIDDRAKVSVSVELETNDPVGPGNVTEVQFWKFENADWFIIPLQLADWNDAKAVSVPLHE